MNVLELVFHGVPQGHDVWGSSGDKYYESFYNILEQFKGAKSAFVVEIRKDANKICSYYSYIRSKNVVAESGREGSYFGFSLKVDGQFCTDVFSLYTLFEKVYREKIAGKVLSVSGNAERFNYAKFSDAESILVDVRNLTMSMLQGNFENDFDDIDATFSKEQAQTNVYYNPDDVNSEAFFDATRICGKVYISPDYPSKDTLLKNLTAIENRYKSAKAELEAKIEKLEEENHVIPGLKQEITALKHQIGQSQEKLANAEELINKANAATKKANENVLSLSQESSKLKEEIKQLKKDAKKASMSVAASHNNSNAAIARQYEMPVETYPESQERPIRAEYDGIGGRSLKRHFAFDGTPKWLLPAILALLIIIIVFFLLNYFQNNKTSHEKNLETAELIVTEGEDAETQAEENQYDPLYDGQNFPGYENVSFQVIDQLTKIPIDGSGSLTRGKPYIVKILGLTNDGDNHVEWKENGFLFLSTDSKQAQVQPECDGAVLTLFVKQDCVYSKKYHVYDEQHNK